MTVAAAFNTLAARYDELWTRSAAGLHQRRAVWRYIDPLFRPGETILDIGCGTGEDALHFVNAELDALLTCPQKWSRPLAAGAFTQPMAIEDLDHMQGSFDGAISNFSAF